MTLKRTGLGLTLALSMLALAACGSDDDDAASTDATQTSTAGSTAADGSVPDTITPDGTPEGTPGATGAGQEGGSEEDGLVGDQPDAEPTEGGVLTFGVYAEAAGLDPTVAVGNGTSGGIELAAIYDTLVRYDPEARAYEPQLAESLEPNADASEFTLSLREGVTFSDGTPLDSEAVVASIKRHTENKSRFAPVVANIESYATPDARTVVFTLTEPWPGFPFVLATSPGMITSPAALEAAGAEEFNTAPVGAGPFTVQHYAPGEVLEVAARDDYWNGRPYLDGLKFVIVAGAQAQLDAIRAGDLQAAFMREPAPIAAAREQGIPGYRNNQNLGSVVLINNGVRGQDRPTEDVRVRQAIAHAIDPQILNERADEGKGFPSKDVLSSTSPFYETASTITYDPERATQLLDEVKAETGWDGSLELACSNIPSRATWAQSAGAMLDAVGFKTTVTQSASLADLISQVAVDADYDLSCWGLNVDNSNPYEAFSLHLGSESPQNTTGFASEELDALIHDLKVADDDAAVTAAMSEIQALFDEHVPIVPTAASPEFIAWAPEVHGIRPTVKSMVLFDKAFIAQ